MNNEEYDKIISTFKELTTIDKCKETIDYIKEIIASFDYIGKLNGIEKQILLNKEMADVNKADATIDDYLEAIYAYLLSLEDVSANLFAQMLKTD